MAKMASKIMRLENLALYGSSRTRIRPAYTTCVNSSMRMRQIGESDVYIITIDITLGSDPSLYRKCEPA